MMETEIKIKGASTTKLVKVKPLTYMDSFWSPIVKFYFIILCFFFFFLKEAGLSQIVLASSLSSEWGREGEGGRKGRGGRRKQSLSQKPAGSWAPAVLPPPAGFGAPGPGGVFTVNQVVIGWDLMCCSVPCAGLQAWRHLAAASWQPTVPRSPARCHISQMGPFLPERSSPGQRLCAWGCVPEDDLRPQSTLELQFCARAWSFQTKSCFLFN